MNEIIIFVVFIIIVVLGFILYNNNISNFELKPVSKHYPTLSDGYAGRASPSLHVLEAGASLTHDIPGPL